MLMFSFLFRDKQRFTLILTCESCISPTMYCTLHPALHVHVYCYRISINFAVINCRIVAETLLLLYYICGFAYKVVGVIFMPLSELVLQWYTWISE